LRIAAFGAAVPLLLRLGLVRLERILEPRRHPRSGDPARIHAVAHRVDWVLRRARPLVRPGCLTRGLTLFYFLRREGADVSLAFGMGKPGDDFAGHCWLVKDDEPFLERTDPRHEFPEIMRIPRRRPAVQH
jgi:hypothetical protein